MEKTVTVIGRAAAGRIREQRTNLAAEKPKDHLKVWRDIYKDVRRQWTEAEHGRNGRHRPLK